MEREKIILKVSSGTNLIQLSDAIYSKLAENKEVEITSAGSHATNQMVKALAIVRTKYLGKSKNLVWHTHFEDTVGQKDGANITIMVTKPLFI